MKAVISTTYDDRYLFFLPIVAWCWNKLGVDVICFLPSRDNPILTNNDYQKIELIKRNSSASLFEFKCPENKEATYAQCSRLYACCLDLPKDEVLVTSDIDMAVFKVPPHEGSFWYALTILGVDLVPEGQFPMCYASGTAEDWRETMQINGRSYQQCLDGLLGEIECENMRGNYWSKDQGVLYNQAHETAIKLPRARPGTQFANHRVDRDDINWRSYVNDDLIDAHLWRPGYEENNFNNILELLQAKFPNDNFQWLVDYRNEYIKLL